MKSVCVILFAIASALAGTDPINELNDRGLEATEHRQFDVAEKLFNEAIERWQALGPAYEAHIAIARTNLAQVYAGQGDRAKSAAMLEQALAGFRHSLGIRNIRSLTALNLLGGVQMLVGNERRAQELFEEALPIERELFPNDRETARTLGGLAALALQQNRGTDALPLAEEALSKIIQADGEDSLDVAFSYGNVAESHRILGRPERAAPLFRKSRAIYERLLGPDHPRVASVLTQEGLILMNEGKLGAAESALVRSVEIIRKSCAGCAYERVAAENDLALLRIRQGKYEDAAQLLTDVLALQEQFLNLPGPEIAVALQSLAVVRQKERRYDEAERLRRRAQLLTTSFR